MFKVRNVLWFILKHEVFYIQGWLSYVVWTVLAFSDIIHLDSREKQPQLFWNVEGNVCGSMVGFIVSNYVFKFKYRKKPCFFKYRSLLPFYWLTQNWKLLSQVRVFNPCLDKTNLFQILEILNKLLLLKQLYCLGLGTLTLLETYLFIFALYKWTVDR